MVSSITGSQSPNVLAGLPAGQATPSGSTTSFSEQLLAALEGYLGQARDGAHLQIDIQSTQSQNSGVRQFLVTVKNPDSGLGQPPAPVRTIASLAAPVNVSANISGPNSPVLNEMDAYWAAQPEPVQALRSVADFGARSNLANDLADQGYTIDLPIMVWGWDPMKTMMTRQMYGYTWVPSMNQAPASTPGLSVLGQTPYDPDHPPAGSIAVNTDFANGLEITDPWA